MNSNNNHSNTHIVVLYTKGLSESFKNICGKIGIQVHFGQHHQKPPSAPKDKDNITQ